jgi:hypothetical protein
VQAASTSSASGAPSPSHKQQQQQASPGHKGGVVAAVTPLTPAQVPYALAGCLHASISLAPIKLDRVLTNACREACRLLMVGRGQTL